MHNSDRGRQAKVGHILGLTTFWFRIQILIGLIYLHIGLNNHYIKVFNSLQCSDKPKMRTVLDERTKAKGHSLRRIFNSGADQEFWKGRVSPYERPIRTPHIYERQLKYPHKTHTPHTNAELRPGKICCAEGGQK